MDTIFLIIMEILIMKYYSFDQAFSFFKKEKAWEKKKDKIKKGF